MLLKIRKEKEIEKEERTHSRLTKPKALIVMLVVAVIAIIGLIIKTNGFYTYTDYNNLEWEYLKDGSDIIDLHLSAVTYDNLINTDTIEIPESIKGSKVKKIGYTTGNGSKIKINMLSAHQKHNIGHVFNDLDYNDSKIKIIKIPSSVVEIEDNAFCGLRSLTYVNIPDSVEEIGNKAFMGTNSLENITLPEGLKYIGKNAFYRSGLKGSLIIPSSVEEVGEDAFSNNTNLNEVIVESGETLLGNDAFYGIDNVYIKCNKKDAKKVYVQFLGLEHYLDCKHTVKAEVVEGIKIINDETGEEIENSEFDCGSDVTFHIEKEEGYEYNNDLTISIISDIERSANGEMVTEETEMELEIGQSYTIENILRNKIIVVKDEYEEPDLTLRQYITKINNHEVETSRIPNPTLVNAEIEYRHTKYPVEVKTGDRVEYNIRVYNEGKTAGSATEITTYIPEGLEYISDDKVNIENNWVYSGEENKLTTDKLATKEIEPYFNTYNPKYKEIKLVLKVTKEREEGVTRLVTISEITGVSSEAPDSTIGNIEGSVGSDYKYDLSIESNQDSYIKGQEKDDDFENIVLPGILTNQVRLKLEKIDGVTNEYLNGAKFELLDEEKNSLGTQVTAKGGVIDFGIIPIPAGEEKEYYLKEIETPAGYKNALKYTIKVNINNELLNSILGTTELKVKYNIEDIDLDTSEYEIVPIYTKEQFRKIGNGQRVKIDQDGKTYTFDNTKMYKLMNDIDLESKAWTPIKKASGIMIDGGNYKIKNLSINLSESETRHVGLFSDFSGLIQNLTLENVNIQVQRTPPVKDNPNAPISETDCVGAFAGYSENAFIRNCKVTGNIVTNVKNVGGFIGHSAKSNIIIFRKCTNEANVKGETNIGGLIGCSFTALEIVEGKNIGKIEATVYNAGGLVGCNLSEGYNVKNVDTRYDEKNNEVIVTVKNNKITGLYTLNLENVDIDDLELLDGSKYAIYGANKEIIEGKEEIEVVGGKIQVDTIDIDRLGTDTYYLRQIEGPEGYLTITTGYYKLKVEKVWDSSENKYTVKVNGETITDKEFEEDKVEEDGVIIQTGVEKENNTYIKAKQGTNRVGIFSSVNQGKVINNYTYISYNRTSYEGNAGGLIGKSKSDVFIDGCSNEKEIESYNHLGGLIGQAMQQDEDTEVKIINSNNSGNFNNNNSNGNISMGGIIAEAINNNVIIKNCNNTGNITKINGSTGGIAGNLGNNKKIVIEKCNNEGTINGSSGNMYGSGGIVGKAGMDTTIYFESKMYDFITMTISECNNTGNIFSNGHIGGIIGIASCIDEYKIIDCTTSDCTIVSNSDSNSSGNSDMGGIIGFDHSYNTTIENCKLINSDIIQNCASRNTSTSIGGILGNKSGLGYGKESQLSSATLVVKNCHVIESNLNGNAEIGGIVGKTIQIGELTILIEKCSVKGAINEDGTKGEPVNILSRCTRGYISGAAGIIYQVHKGASNRKSINLTIKECDLYNANIVCGDKNGSYYDINVSGILAFAYGINNLEIQKCNINETNIENNYIDANNNVGGVLAYIGYDGKNSISDICIQNTKIVLEDGGSAGGIVGWTNVQDINFSNCIIDHTDIISYADHSHSRRATTGGIVGYLSYSRNQITTIENCNVINSNFETNGSGLGGMIGAGDYDSNITINECDVESTKLSMKKPVNYSNNIYYGLGGIMAYGAFSKISNCNIIDSELSINNDASHIGGIVASSGGKKGEISDCNVSGTKITRKDYEYNLQASSGGILGTGSAEINILRCTVSDVDINTLGSETGGICGNLYNSNSIISDCIVEDSYINSGSTINKSNKGSVGGIVGTNRSKEISNCTVRNTDIETISDNIGGIAGYSQTNNINGCIIDDVSLYHTGEVTPYSSSTTYYRSIGGIAGIIANNGESNIINNPTINKLDITVAGGNSGIGTLSTGGVIGLVAGTSTTTTGTKTEITGATINDLSIENYSPSGHAGGLIGMTTYKPESGEISVSANGLTMDDVDITANGHIGGVIGFIPSGKVEVKSQTNGISNIELNYPDGSDNTNQSIGGVVGITGGTIDIDIPVSGVTLKGKSNIGGILGIGPGGTIGNIINGINITQDNNEDNIIDIGNVGGLVGTIDKTENETETSENLVVNADVDDISVTCNECHIGGIVGIAKTYFEYNGDASNITVTNTSTNDSNNIYGVAGILGTMDDTNPDAVAIINGTLTKCNATNNGYVSAVVGLGKVETEGFTVTDANIINKNSDTNSSSNNVAGIFTGLLYPGSEIRNVNINDSEVTSADRVGGIAGITGTGTGVTIDQCNVSNVKIKSTAETPSSVGGIVGHLGNTTDTITNSNVTNNSSITATGGSNAQYEQEGQIGGITGFSNGVIEGCNVTDTSISTIVQDVGGIVGLQGESTAEVNNCTVERVTITNTKGRTGGIAGYTNSTIDNCHVIDSNITGSDSVGGLVGHGSNITTILTYITGSTVEGTNITGTDNVGGIIGTAGATIENCEVKSSENKNTEITGTNNVGGIMGNSGMITQDTQQGASISGTTIKDAIITGTTNVEYILGKILEFASSYTGSQVDTISDDSVQTNCTLNAE